MRAIFTLSCVVLLTAACGDDGGTADGGFHDGSAMDAPARDGGPDTDGGPVVRPDATPPPPVCGDGRCTAGETASSCGEDCGPCPTLPGAPTALEDTLLNMPADSWYEHPGSDMGSVCARGPGTCRNVVAAWSGGAFDSARNRLILWGGGHGDYDGNELYAFDVAMGTWSRLTEPSTGETQNQDPLPDGNPVSRHTYDGVEIIAHADRLFGQGGSRASDGSGTDITWTYPLAGGSWMNEMPAEDGPGGVTLASAYDPMSRLLIMRATQDIYSYDLDSNTWTHLMNFGLPPEWPRYERSGDKTGVVDPTRGLFWSVGSGDILVWDIARAVLVTEDWVTTGGGAYSNADWVDGHSEQLFESGGGDVYDENAPGIDYDAAADALVAWANEGGPYALDLETKVWTRGSGTGAPTSMTSGGTFGRWRYINDYNVFVLVTSVEENVFFYKHTRCL